MILRMAPFLCIEESFGKRIMFYLQCSYLLILVGCYSDELSVCERDVGHHPVASSYTNNVNLRFVLMERIQHDLASSIEFVGQFDFVEGHWSFHPVGTEVRGVGVDVDTAVTVRLRFARRDPLAVYVLPAVPVCRAEVQQERIHGVGIQTRHADLQNWKHPPAVLRHNHLIGDFFEFPPEFSIFQGDFELFLSGVPLLSAGL